MDIHAQSKKVNKTPEYTLKAQKAYYQRMKEDPDYMEKMRLRAKAYRLKKKAALAELTDSDD